jgi:hypothetical protein
MSPTQPRGPLVDVLEPERRRGDAERVINYKVEDSAETVKANVLVGRRGCRGGRWSSDKMGAGMIDSPCGPYRQGLEYQNRRKRNPMRRKRARLRAREKRIGRSKSE